MVTHNVSQQGHNSAESFTFSNVSILLLKVLSSLSDVLSFNKEYTLLIKMKCDAP